jgi:hypothetical protein
VKLSPESVPATLRGMKRWVAWRVLPPKKAGDKFGKRPVNPHSGKPASTTDEATWGTFDEAVARMQKDALAGVGFVFVAKDGNVGIDLDHCRNPDTGEIAPWAAAIIKQVATYSEVSPSGTGVHLIGRGTLPPGSRRKGDVEMYCEGRFFTMTGAVLDAAHAEVADRDAEIRALHADVFRDGRGSNSVDSSGTPTAAMAPDEVVRRLGETSKPERAVALWRGDVSGYKSRSEGELALCGFLRQIVGEDAQAIDQLFRKSGLMRDKWDERRGSTTYGQGTIAKALEEASGPERRKPSLATKAAELVVNGGTQLFMDSSRFAYATVDVDGHRETLRIGDQAFADWLALGMYRSERRVPSKNAINDACALLRAQALATGIVETVNVRIAGVGDEIFLDLGQPDHSVVKITSLGWEVLPSSPIPFRRPRGLLPLPVPARGGNIGMLRPFVNCKDEDWPLVLGWLVASYRGTGPYPVFALLSDKGSGKSTGARVMRMLVDPNLAPLRSEPKEARDLAITANNSWVVAFDNLSSLPPWLSDALCRLATGGGFATRSLYTNDEETIFDAQRPTIVTAIGDVIARSDLLDRAVTVTPLAIEPDARKPERLFWQEFAAAQPKILGAIFDIVAAGLARLPSVRLQSLPRMADFALWATACEPAMGLRAGAFMASYSRSQAVAVEVAIDSNSAAAALRDYVIEGNVVEGLTATELLDLLNARRAASTQPPSDWPKSAAALSARLHRTASDLKSIGIELRFERLPATRKRVIHARLKLKDGDAGYSASEEGTDPGRSSWSAGTTTSESSSREDPREFPESGASRDARDAQDGDSGTAEVAARDGAASGAAESSVDDVAREAKGSASELLTAADGHPFPHIEEHRDAESPSRASRPSRSQENGRDDDENAAVPKAPNAVPAESDSADSSEQDLASDEVAL